MVTGVRRLLDLRRAGAGCGALAACYASRGLLLDADEAAHPLENGVYAQVGGDRWRVGLDLDGWYRLEQVYANGTIGETHRVLFNELPMDGLKAYALAEQTDDGFAYAVAVKRGDQVFLATPDCADPLDKDVAQDHGGVAQTDDSMSHNCLFRRRGELLSALAAYANQADFGAPYQREADKTWAQILGPNPRQGPWSGSRPPCRDNPPWSASSVCRRPAGPGPWS